MLYNFDISNLFSMVFGRSYNVAMQPATNKAGYSPLGTPLADKITFKGKTYNKYDGGLLVQVTLPDFVLPYTSLFEFSRRKTITETPVNGYYGTVKEMYATEAWQINIQGLILPQDNKTSRQVKDELLQYEQIADTIEILTGECFTEKDIFGLVITDVSFPALKGYSDVFPFSIQAVSDETAQLFEYL